VPVISPFVCLSVIVNFPRPAAVPAHSPANVPTTNVWLPVAAPPRPSDTVTEAVSAPPVTKVITTVDPVNEPPPMLHAYVNGSPSGSVTPAENLTCVLS